MKKPQARSKVQGNPCCRSYLLFNPYPCRCIAEYHELFTKPWNLINLLQVLTKQKNVVRQVLTSANIFNKSKFDKWSCQYRSTYQLQLKLQNTNFIDKFVDKTKQMSWWTNKNIIMDQLLTIIGLRIGCIFVIFVNHDQKFNRH